ncbi:ATP-binding cassette domain-containing protein [Photobacterium chitinilyticum]|uniref:ATP-binding cassette domain-containing protein n=1 Tax=Photobacterium chitinilyticum TaxID=2485123 RepID=A0A3S3T2B1_9GAMM|nr:ATP-binding cassette domain-containing protein [Photobacterium chitinilyticum]RWX57522.1 ATP-binding cassette domain-containing protein [Photobacterium chitinilyticum]
MTLSVENLTLSNNEQHLFQPVNFTVEPGNVLTLMGPSGCGKSTLLSAIAGHLSPVFLLEGTISLNGLSMIEMAPDQRRIGILFQDDLLFPHLNIWENLAFGLPKTIRGTARKEKAIATLQQIGLRELAGKMPTEISGGQRARISLMRMLLSEPHTVLLDEPFSKLDKALRSEFRDFVFEQIRQQQVPALMVTHDDDDIPDGGSVLRWPWAESPQEGRGLLC